MRVSSLICPFFYFRIDRDIDLHVLEKGSGIERFWHKRVIFGWLEVSLPFRANKFQGKYRGFDPSLQVLKYNLNITILRMQKQVSADQDLEVLWST